MDAGTKKFALAVAGITGVICIVVVATKGSSAEPAPTAGLGAVPSSPQAKAVPTSEFPSVISREWCGQLASHLEPRLQAEANAKYPGRDTSTVHDHVLNLVNNCREDIGKPVDDVWKCFWSESLEEPEKCSDMKKARDKAKKEAEKANNAELEAAEKVVQMKTDVDRYERDSRCTGEGKPPYHREFSGGTFAQDKLVATSRGCVSRMSSDPTDFCCPR